MAYKSQIKASNRYNAKQYDNLQLRIKSGGKAMIQAAANVKGMSLNQYMLTATARAILEDGGPDIAAFLPDPAADKGAKK